MFTGSLVATVLHFKYKKTQEGLKMIILNKAPTGNQFRESKQKETVRHVVLLAVAPVR